MFKGKETNGVEGKKKFVQGLKKVGATRDIVIVPTSLALIAVGEALIYAGMAIQKSGTTVGKAAYSKTYRKFVEKNTIVQTKVDPATA